MFALAELLRGMFPAWRRQVMTYPDHLTFVYGTGHKMNGSFMAEQTVYIHSLEPQFME